MKNNLTFSFYSLNHFINFNEVVFLFSKKCRKLSVYILIVTILGILTIGSASRVWALYKFNDAAYFIKRQAVFALIGVFVMMMASKVNLMKIKAHNKGIYIACMLSLVLVLIPGLGVQRNGSRSWFGVGSLLIQPSEFFKIAIILMSAQWLASRRKIKSFMKDLLMVAAMTLAGFLLMLLQPDFGSGIVMVCSIVIMVLAADSPLSYFMRCGFLGVLAFGALILSAPYRLARITSFIDPWQDPLGSGFQIIQSLFAIAPGGLLGKGFDASVQKHFYLPEPQTDFIFAIFAEEWGFIGCALLILLYILIIYEGVKIARNCENAYLAYVAIGIISLFAIQVLINLGVVVGLFPVTGITLPLFSYGGSSLVVMMGSLGLLMGIANHDSRA